MDAAADSLFDDFERSFFQNEGRQLPAFRTDIKDEGDHFLLEADLPRLPEGGHRPAPSGRRANHYSQAPGGAGGEKGGQVPLPGAPDGQLCRAFDVSGIREEDITAAFEDGVLKLTLPKQGEPVPQSRRIAIQ